MTIRVLDTVQQLKDERAQLRELCAPLQLRMAEIDTQLASLGEQPHHHGSYTYDDPVWWHSHKFNDNIHNHHGSDEERDAQDEARDSFYQF